MRLFSILLNSKKKLIISLQNIFGLGEFSALYICKKLGFNKNTYTFMLTNRHLSFIKQLVLKNFIIQLDLQRKVKENILDLIVLKSYKGFRHKLKLPVRGQRTHTNRMTQRKKLKN